MKNYNAIVEFLRAEYKTTSYYGNPSYYVWFRQSGVTWSGYTGSNCACGYCVSNFRRGDMVKIEYHYTKAGNVVITQIQAEEEKQ